MPEATLYPPPRPLTVGEVLDLSFRIYRRTFAKCLVFGALTVVANWLPNLYSIARGETVAQSVLHPGADLGRAGAALIAGLLAALFPMAIILRQYKMITGAEIGGEFMRALRLLGRIVLMGILFGLAMFACLLFLVPAFFASGLARYALIAVLLLPAMYVLIRFMCCFTAIAVENAGAAGSLARSWELTGGNVLRLAAIDTVAVFLLIVLHALVASLTGFLYVVLGKTDVALISAAVGVMIVAAGALASPYYSALGLAIFGDLAARKEGVDLAQRITAEA